LVFPKKSYRNSIWLHVPLNLWIIFIFTLSLSLFHVIIAHTLVKYLKHARHGALSLFIITHAIANPFGIHHTVMCEPSGHL